MKVLLWDIDGTLINNDRAGMYAWFQALEEENGGPVAVDVAAISPAGLTDVRIAELTLEKVLRRPWDPVVADRILARYVELLPEWLERRNRGRVLPNVIEILELASTRDDIDLALLTGNVREGARRKLSHYGLWDYFSWGSFAEASPDRRDLARRAQQQAEERHGVDAIEAVYVIGDTERDIDCGKAIGARTIGVGTGPMSARELARHDPWWAVEQLPAAPEFLARLG